MPVDELGIRLLVADAPRLRRIYPAARPQHRLRALTGETAYRPMAEQLAHDAVKAAERGDLAVADGYDVAESDRAMLIAQDDVIALTRPRAHRLARGALTWQVDSGTTCS